MKPAENPRHPAVVIPFPNRRPILTPATIASTIAEVERTHPAMALRLAGAALDHARGLAQQQHVPDCIRESLRAFLLLARALDTFGIPVGEVLA